eukprot:4660986-Amphidinium_carterae.1
MMLHCSLYTMGRTLTVANTRSNKLEHSNPTQRLAMTRVWYGHWQLFKCDAHTSSAIGVQWSSQDSWLPSVSLAIRPQMHAIQ